MVGVPCEEPLWHELLRVLHLELLSLFDDVQNLLEVLGYLVIVGLLLLVAGLSDGFEDAGSTHSLVLVEVSILDVLVTHDLVVGILVEGDLVLIWVVANLAVHVALVDGVLCGP